MLAVRVLLASNNAHKLSEVRAIVEPLGIEVLSLADLAISLNAKEDGNTFEENAIKKAEAFREASRLVVLADDSGLEVDALGGQPGVRSARYAGPSASDADRVSLLLRSLGGVPPGARRARFVCVVAIAAPGQRTLTVRGECEGSIASEPRGAHGFGYDPVFVPDGWALTMAELTSSEKNRISHRGRAFRAACAVLQRLAPAC